jgi:hypothetical protein
MHLVGERKRPLRRQAQGLGDLRFRRNLGQVGQGLGMGYHPISHLSSLISGKTDGRPGSRLVTGQQRLHGCGISLASFGQVCAQVSQPTVSHSQLGIGPASRSTLEQDRSPLDRHTQRVGQVAGLAGSYDGDRQRREEQRTGDDRHRQPPGPPQNRHPGQPRRPGRTLCHDLPQSYIGPQPLGLRQARSG